MTRIKLRTRAAAPAYKTLSTELGLNGLDPYASGVTATTSPKWMNASVCTSQFLAKNFCEQIREICQKKAIYQAFHLEIDRRNEDRGGARAPASSKVGGAALCVAELLAAVGRRN